MRSTPEVNCDIMRVSLSRSSSFLALGARVPAVHLPVSAFPTGVRVVSMEVHAYTERPPPCICRASVIFVRTKRQAASPPKDNNNSDSVSRTTVVIKQTVVHANVLILSVSVFSTISVSTQSCCLTAESLNVERYRVRVHVL